MLTCECLIWASLFNLITLFSKDHFPNFILREIKLPLNVLPLIHARYDENQVPMSKNGKVHLYPFLFVNSWYFFECGPFFESGY